ncbi:unnamed protein product [Rotaria sp. Silwood2]|nr:unnamed protein product [Rotaria sp. Silwood2]
MKVTVAQPRLFTKDGKLNVNRRITVKRRCCRYLNDYFTTLLDFNWRWIFLFLTLTFVASWLLFAAVWFIIMKVHGDFEPSGRTPCVAGVTTFVGCILFSVETQQTIGYGTRSVTQQCTSGVITLMVQAWFGLIIQSLWMGIIYTKLARPKRRRHTLMWSHQALIGLRNNHLTLQVRLGDVRPHSTLLEAHVRMYFISKRNTHVNEVLPLNLVDMNVGFDTGHDRLLLVWPVTIEHRIDPKSPLWLMDKKAFARAEFEVLVVFEGIIESTGLLTQTRTSYSAQDIVWGANFEPILYYDSIAGLRIDYSKFNSSISDNCIGLFPTIPVITKDDED